MSERVSILCVDDESNVLRAMERMFLDSDYEVLLATSVDEGLKILAGHPQVQVVISDFRMPGKNGAEFLAEVGSRWPDTIRIILSGDADLDAVIGAINQGQIYRFILKPWSDNDLLITVANAVSLYELHRQNRLLAAELARKNKALEKANDTLQRIVAEKVSRVELQNGLLRTAHSVLESFPVAELAIDDDGVVVHCNAGGRELFGVLPGQTLMRGDYTRLLDPEVAAFVKAVLSEGSASGTVEHDGESLPLQGEMVKGDGFNGVIVWSCPCQAR